MTWIELIATLFGLACVWFYIRQSIWSWPTGLVQVCLYVWIFFQARLYSDFLLQLVYVVLQVYGWYYWLRGSGKQAGELPVVRLSRRSTIAWLGVVAVGTAALGFVMRRYTNAALPYWDAAITVLSLVAQYLLARKVLENWPIWVMVDVLAIGVYLAKQLYITTGLYAVFLGMAIAGWIAWQRSYRIASAKAFDGVAASSSASSSPLTAGTSS